MVGLSFPDAREVSASVDDATVTDDEVLIDPALRDLDPALLAEQNQQLHLEQLNQNLVPPPADHASFSPGPQGDPFAPQPLDFFPAPPPPLPTQQTEASQETAGKKKRKRKKVEGVCGFCSGKKNKLGEEEKLVSCAECLRSAHSSCAQLSHITPAITSYDWKCNDCTVCEICRTDPEDVDMTLCESCDRGWHPHCLNPPLPAAPEGDWFCPLCTGLSQGREQPGQPRPDGELVSLSDGVDGQADGTPDIPDYDPASTKKSQSQSRRQKKSRSHTANTNEAGPSSLKRRRTTFNAPRKKRKVLEEDSEVDGEEDEGGDEDEDVVERSPRKKGPRLVLKLGTAKGKERAHSPSPERDEYADILSPPDRDVSRTTITASDKARFERARLAVEAKGLPPAKPLSGIGSSGRNTRSAHLAALAPSNPLLDVGSGRSASPSISTPIASTPTNAAGPSQPRIKTIRLGVYDIQTWYDAPFPEEYAQIPDGRLWLCEFCLKHMKSEFTAARHRLKCKARHPPGDEVYRDGSVSVWEVDGRHNKLYCQNLCLLSKMFLDHKSLFYDVEPFLFYVLTELDQHGAQFVGYFSKEKRSPNEWNLSCIMCLPVRQRRGFGNALIEFSYLLSQKERRLGSPEKPLSALGALGYKNYWTLAIMRYLNTAPPKPRLEDISRATSMTVEDVYNTLDRLGFIRVHTAAAEAPSRPRLFPGQSMRYPPQPRRRPTGTRRTQTTSALGSTPPPIPVPSTSTATAAAIQTSSSTAAHGALAPASSSGHAGTSTPLFVPPRRYDIVWDPARVREHLTTWEAKGYLRIYPTKLRWTPYLFSRPATHNATDIPLAQDGKPEIVGLVWHPKDPTPEPEPEPEVVEVEEVVEETSTPRPRTRRSTRQEDVAVEENHDEAGPSTSTRAGTPRLRSRVSKPDLAAEDVTPRPKRHADRTTTPARSPEVPAIRRLRSGPNNDELPALFPLPVTVSRSRIRKSSANSIKSTPTPSTSPIKSGRTRQSQTHAQVVEPEPEPEPESQPQLRRRPSRKVLEVEAQAKEKEKEKEAAESARKRRKSGPQVQVQAQAQASRAEVVEVEPSEPPTPRKPRNRNRVADVEPSTRTTRRSSRRGQPEEVVEVEVAPEPQPMPEPEPEPEPEVEVEPEPEVAAEPELEVEAVPTLPQRNPKGRFKRVKSAPAAKVAPVHPPPPPSKSRKSQSRRSTAPTRPRKRSRRAKSDDEFEFEDHVSDEDEDEDSLPASPRKPRGGGGGRKSRSRRNASDSDFDDSEPEEAFIVDDDDDETPPASPRKRQGSARRGRSRRVDDSSDVEVVHAPPLTRKGSSNRGSARKRQRVDSEPESEVNGREDVEEAKDAEKEEEMELERELLGEGEEATQVEKPEEGKEDDEHMSAADAIGEAEVDGEPAVNGEAVVDTNEEADAEPDAEGETDDARAPENGRHSAPSDDTVFVAEGTAGMGKPSPAPFTPEAARVSPPPAPEAEPEATRVSTPLELVPTSRPVSRPLTDQDLSDADAEGSTDDEYDK